MALKTNASDMSKKKKTKLDAMIVYQHLQDKLGSALLKHTSKDIHINNIVGSVFNVLGVLFNCRTAMLYDDPQLCMKKSMVTKAKTIINNAIKKFNIPNIKTTLFLNHNTILVYHDKHEKLVKEIETVNKKRSQPMQFYHQQKLEMLFNVKLGKLLNFVCPGECCNLYEDKIIQNMYINGLHFFAQICSASSFNEKEKKMHLQFAKFNNLAKALNLTATMEFTKKPGAETLIRDINLDGIKGIMKHREELINVILNYPNMNNKSKSLKFLQLNNKTKLLQNQEALKKILTHIIIVISDVPFELVEKSLF